jgi:hypothetical protein
MNREAAVPFALCVTTMALVNLVFTACSTQLPKRDAAQPSKRDTPIGTIFRQYAVQRSLQECKVNTVSDEQCGALFSFGAVGTALIGICAFALDTGGTGWFVVSTWRDRSLWDT